MQPIPASPDVLETPSSSVALERFDRALQDLVALYERCYVQEPLERVLGHDEEVSSAQLRTLHFLQNFSGAWVGDLASGLGISYPAASKAVDRLCERGLAERFRDADDARRIRVNLSQRGVEVLLEVQRQRLARLAVVMQDLGQHGESLPDALEGFIALSRLSSLSGLSSLSRSDREEQP
jgi:DNA-binding MarR family transcriptional regulator